MLIAQLTDSHLLSKDGLFKDRIDTASALRAAVDRVNALDPAPDVVLLTGDLANHGEPEAYRRAKAILETVRAPLYLIPGNHDDRENWRENLGEKPWSRSTREGFVQYAVDDFPLRLIGLDTLDPGHDWGAFCERRLQWLEETLAAGEGRPALLFMHHPPFATGITTMDALGLAGAPALEKVVRGHPEIVAVVCGHVHRAIFTGWAGKPTMICPGLAHHLALDFSGDLDVDFTLEPPGFMMHWFDESSGRLVSHVQGVAETERFSPFDHLLPAEKATVLKEFKQNLQKLRAEQQNAGRPT